MIHMIIKDLVVSHRSHKCKVILSPQCLQESQKILPIKIGSTEAAAIAAGLMGNNNIKLSHDLIGELLEHFDATIDSIQITAVNDTRFIAHVKIVTGKQDRFELEARPSDALALSVRHHAPIFVTHELLNAAGMTDFDLIKESETKAELENFRDFLDNFGHEE